MVTLSDRVVRELDRLKEQLNTSYSGAIEELIRFYKSFNPDLLKLEPLNEGFTRLKQEYPQLHTVLELMRVICVRLLKSNVNPRYVELELERLLSSINTLELSEAAKEIQKKTQ